MGSDTTRILIETLVRKALRDIQDSPARSTRNLVDMALHFSKGRFQQSFFEIAQTMLQNENSPYYDLVRRTVSHVPAETLLRFGVNIGYNGCTVGAKTIRSIEAAEGYSIPWTVLIQLPQQLSLHCMNRYQQIFHQGESVGIHSWKLFAQGCPHNAIPFVQGHPDSAFSLFCDPKDITLTFLDCIADLRNLMVVLRMNQETTAACALLQEVGILHSVYYPYSEQNTDPILNGKLFQEAQQMGAVFTATLPHPSCSQTLKEKVYETIRKMRIEQLWETFPFDLFGDCRLIDSIISDDACFAWFDEEGFLCHPSKSHALNLLQCDLTEIFRQAFPKAKGVVCR